MDSRRRLLYRETVSKVFNLQVSYYRSTTFSRSIIIVRSRGPKSWEHCSQEIWVKMHDLQEVCQVIWKASQDMKTTSQRWGSKMLKYVLLGNHLKPKTLHHIEHSPLPELNKFNNRVLFLNFLICHVKVELSCNWRLGSKFILLLVERVVGWEEKWRLKLNSAKVVVDVEVRCKS